MIRYLASRAAKTDRRSQQSLAAGYFQLGELTEKIGSQPDALAVHRKALALRRELAAAADADMETRLDVARSLRMVGRLLSATGDKSAALAAFEEQRAICAGLAAEFPSDTIRTVLAQSHHSIGWILVETGQVPQALPWFEGARAIRQELAVLQAEDKLTPDMVFRDPYILDFLGLKDTYAEKDLEAAILREMEAFILELGVGFCFVARQKRMQIDDKDYYLDLLFYHRKLRRLVAIDLKIGDFEAGDKGQMELYLRWLDRHDRRPGEEKPIGLILCAGKSAEHIELLELEASGIRVAEYLTELPPRPLLEQKLHAAIALARHRLQQGLDEQPAG